MARVLVRERITNSEYSSVKFKVVIEKEKDGPQVKILNRERLIQITKERSGENRLRTDV